MHVLALWLYPIKSCAGIAVDEAELTTRGLRWDRRFMLVDPEGVAITAREAPSLLRVRTQLVQDALIIEADGASLTLPFEPSWGAACEASMFDKRFPVCEVPAAHVFFSRYLQRDARLVGQPASMRRPINPKYAFPEDELSLADGYPVTLVSVASLEELRAQIEARARAAGTSAPECSAGASAAASAPDEATVDMGRFRANIIIDGTEAFCEDTFSRVRVGATALRQAKRTARCQIVSLDANGVAHKEPLRTLSQFRKDGQDVYFACSMIPELGGEPSLTVRVGDEVEPIL